jgi:DNA helicase-2/ATP-dependent DNA helicase PcrA
LNAPEGEINTLSDFLVDVALLTDADNEKEEDKNKITLMTVHAAKGLEFPIVYIVGMEENLFPSQLSLNSREELEEERRLFYVALTRAEQSCYLSYAINRFRYGNLQRCEPSRFIDEIGKHLLVFENENPSSSGMKSLNAKSISNQYGTHSARSVQHTASLKPLSSVLKKPDSVNLTNDLKVGHNVYHHSFGKGKVIQLNGTGEDKKAIIFFPSAGQKTLLLRFAKLDILT